MKSCKIFIVEDDELYGKILTKHLSLNPDFQVMQFLTANDCLKNLYQKPNIICIDYALPDMNGAELMKKIRKEFTSIPIIIVSGQEEIEIAIDLLKSGANDYIVKDTNTKQMLWKSVNSIIEKLSLEDEIDSLKEQLNEKYSLDNYLIGQSEKMQSVFSKIRKAVQTNITVSITGETGTGKEVVAQTIHFNSTRKKKKFVAINMASIPKELVESELFGYEKGAFTGAEQRKIGKFEEANGGTLFLDEISEMDILQQSKLLRVLQERELTRIGGNEIIKLDVRLLIATHKNLGEEVKKGSFREDLYYRLIGLPIEIPPLRERGNDLFILAQHFIEQFCKQNNMKQPKLSPYAQEKLNRYNFPGNVRELKAVIELACVMCDGEITENDITFFGLENNNLAWIEEKPLRQYTIEIIEYYLKKYNNDIGLAAEKLDIGKSTIYNMIKNGEINYKG